MKNYIIIFVLTLASLNLAAQKKDSLKENNIDTDLLLSGEAFIGADERGDYISAGMQLSLTRNLNKIYQLEYIAGYLFSETFFPEYTHDQKRRTYSLGVNFINRIKSEKLQNNFFVGLNSQLINKRFRKDRQDIEEHNFGLGLTFGYSLKLLTKDPQGIYLKLKYELPIVNGISGVYLGLGIDLCQIKSKKKP